MVEKEGILETFSNDNSFDQLPFSKQRLPSQSDTGSSILSQSNDHSDSQPRVSARLIGTQARFCTAWTLEPVLGFAFICFYIRQVELLEASKL